MADFYRAELVAPVLPLVRGSADRAGVRRLQEWLVVRGFTVVRDLRAAPGIDGDFGNGTQAGVEAFAKAHSISPVVDERFWTWLVMGMRMAFEYRPRATDLGDAIVEVAEAHLIQKAREARALVGQQLMGADNTGPWCRAYLGPVPPSPWCQGFANRIRDAAARALGVTLKVPTVLDGIDCLWVPRVVEEHRRKNLLLSGRQLAGSIGPGCLFFVPGMVGDQWTHIHVGIVTDVRGALVETIEGNTNTDGSANGLLVCRRERAIASLDFGLVA